MDAHKRYTIGLLSLIFGVMLVLVATSFYLQPLVGDVTRLGDYAENDFGWNGPMPVFAQEAAPLKTAYEEYADVLAVGDSFSFGGLYGMLNFPWQRFLAVKTGFSVASISHYTHTNPPTYDPELLPAIVNSETFKKSPPRVLILEIVERQLDMLPKYPGSCQAEHALTPPPSFQLRPSPAPMTEAQRKQTRPSLKEQIAYAQKYLLGQAHRPWEKNPIVYRLALTTPKLFSNRQSDHVLVYEGDVKKRAWDAKLVEAIGCRLLNAQNLVQKNGKTLFVAMLVPDKLTAYSRYLKDSAYANASVIERLAAVRGLHLARLDQAMGAQVDAGVVDVYLPNDTHWAFHGHETAASVLARYLADFSGD
jgi:hypothetical protein